jgi:hypothetical protein
MPTQLQIKTVFFPFFLEGGCPKLRQQTKFVNIGPRWGFQEPNLSERPDNPNTTDHAVEVRMLCRHKWICMSGSARAALQDVGCTQLAALSEAVTD